MTHVTSVPTIRVVGGIDTHKDLHMAAVVDRDDGRLLETKDFSTTRAGYRALLRWMRQHGALESVGIEGTGSYGAGIMRFLHAAGVTTHEVDRPDRSDRRRRGKSDAVDAEIAARAVISGRRLSTPKNKNGRVEALRVLRLTRAGAVRSRTKALQLLRSHAVSAQDEVRDEVRSLTRMQLLRIGAAWPTVLPSSSTNRTAPALNSSVNCRRARRGLTVAAMVDIVSAFRNVSTSSDQGQGPPLPVMSDPSAEFKSVNTLDRTMSVNTLPRAVGNTSGWPSPRVRAALRISTARPHRYAASSTPSASRPTRTWSWRSRTSCFGRGVGPVARRSSATRASTIRRTAGPRLDGSWRKSSTTSASCSRASASS